MREISAKKFKVHLKSIFGKRTQRTNHKGLWISMIHLKLISEEYLANRPQKALHEDEMETSELHRNVWTTP